MAGRLKELTHAAPECEPFKNNDHQLYKLGLPNQFDILDPRFP